MSEMTCRQMLEHLHDFLAGILPKERAAQFDVHLQECVECQEYLRTYREAILLTRTALSESKADALCDEMPEDLVQAILRSFDTDK